MPHEALKKEILTKVTLDPLWVYVEKIFDIGFQQHINERFKSCISLIDHIDSIIDNKVKMFNFFGYDILGNFNIVVAKFNLPSGFDSNDPENRVPNTNSPTYIRYPDHPYSGIRNNRITVHNPLPLTEVISLAEFSATVNDLSGHLPKLAVDADVWQTSDISYCSIGAATITSNDRIYSESNSFYSFEFFEIAPGLLEGKVVDREDFNRAFIPDGVYDYAIILKYRPNDDRVQIFVAGIGVWGTRGGCWYLSNNWRKLEELFTNKEFGAVIKVKNEVPESAELIHCKGDLEKI